MPAVILPLFGNVSTPSLVSKGRFSMSKLLDELVSTEYSRFGPAKFYHDLR